MYTNESLRFRTKFSTRFLSYYNYTCKQDRTKENYKVGGILLSSISSQKHAGVWKTPEKIQYSAMWHCLLQNFIKKINSKLMQMTEKHSCVVQKNDFYVCIICLSMLMKRKFEQVLWSLCAMCLRFSDSFNSSVGRASDWRSEGPVFDSQLKHMLFAPINSNKTQSTAIQSPNICILIAQFQFASSILLPKCTLLLYNILRALLSLSSATQS